MNIVLIYPLLSRKRSVEDENKQFWPPLGLGYLAAVFEEKGHHVKIIDRDVVLRKNKLDFDKTDKITFDEILNFNADYVGISVTTPTVYDAKFVSDKIKELSPEIKTVIGGPHCMGEPELTMDLCKGIDILVRGEGEFTFLDIISGKPLNDTKGIHYRSKNGSIKSTSYREPTPDLDTIPMPARHLMDMDFYLRPSRFTSRNLNLKTTSIVTARGCPYSCNYCASPIIDKGKVRFRSPEIVIKEIKELIEAYGVEALYFAEDMFLAHKKRARKILDLMCTEGINKKIKWIAQLSSNIVSEDFLMQMKEAGCVHVEYGFESGSQRVLDLMGKSSTVEKNIRAVKLTKKAGLHFQGNFIVGYPGETEEDFIQTMKFIKMAKPSNIALNVFMPLPGTEAYNKLKREGKKIPDWSEIGDPDAPQLNYANISQIRFQKLYHKYRLTLILPLNLLNFIKANIRNPWRLLYISTTQFKGVFIKAFNSLRALKKKEEAQL